MTYDEGIEEKQQPRRDLKSLEPSNGCTSSSIQNVNSCQKSDYAKESEPIEQRHNRKRTSRVNSGKKNNKETIHFSPNSDTSKVQFEINKHQIGRRDGPSQTRETSSSIIGPENTMVSSRAVNSSSCTGGSTDAKKAARKFVNAQLSQPIKSSNVPNVKKVQVSTGVRINALETVKKPQKQNGQTGILKLQTHLSPNTGRVQQKVSLMAEAIRNCAATP